MPSKSKILIKRILFSLCAFLLLMVAFTVYANLRVDQAGASRIYSSVDSVPYNKVGLLLGTNPLNTGFRTLDSVVRAIEVFGCDSLTIISQADHNARALYLAEVNGIEAVAVSAPLRAGRLVRIRLALREWLARDKMMLDIWFGKQPHFLGEKILIPDRMPQKSYATADGVTMRIVSPYNIKAPVDSIVVELINSRDIEGHTGEWFRIDKLEDGQWKEIPLERSKANSDGSIAVIFNAVAWILFPDKPFYKTIDPWFYERDWKAGTYRIAKTFDYPPYPRTTPSDTVYVEFQIR
ncbi:MAG: hypothetical protein HDS37_04415 [Bacteroides sp.]|nr:hypothetical protein [Bacteroides sp.]